MLAMLVDERDEGGVLDCVCGGGAACVVIVVAGVEVVTDSTEQIISNATAFGGSKQLGGSSRSSTAGLNEAAR